ncbi:hypothetical protein J1N35_022369 [Gossypium stocksii]|uniref:Uncharacterized protein n=1 Tax=Gossypium stocksii TaxID=47602 RepID=A0A9D3VGM5_9ROSI|nr:hypothetical protein J1N35_022369 [Gossypium stocksii]
MLTPTARHHLCRKLWHTRKTSCPSFAFNADNLLLPQVIPCPPSSSATPVLSHYAPSHAPPDLTFMSHLSVTRLRESTPPSERVPFQSKINNVSFSVERRAWLAREALDSFILSALQTVPNSGQTPALLSSLYPL